MKTIILATPLLFTLGLAQPGQAQSTTGGRSGGSSASTGTGYLTDGKRPAETSASSMTIADEGASRAYMYVPPTAAKPKNQAASPDGTGYLPSKATQPTDPNGTGYSPSKATQPTDPKSSRSRKTLRKRAFR